MGGRFWGCSVSGRAVSGAAAGMGGIRGRGFGIKNEIFLTVSAG